jgi:hypothetical protein
VLNLEITFIACKTIEDEVNKALKDNNICADVHWVEAGLHYQPDKLKETLQQLIDSSDSSDFIVLLFGLCGNALIGLTSKRSTLVVPKVDDCISLMLGGNEQRKAIDAANRAYYFTKGWLRYDINIWHEYKRSVKQYGSEKAKEIFLEMLKHYTHITVIDTGAYEGEDIKGDTELIAKTFNLKHAYIEGDDSYLSAAVKGLWDDRFLLIKSGNRITPALLRI